MGWSLRAPVLAMLLACALNGAACAAQDAGRWDDVLAEVAGYLEEDYVYPETGRTMAAFVRGEAARYNAIEDIDAFAGQLSDDLYAIANDHHLRVWRVGSRGMPGSAPMSRDQLDYCRTAEIEHRWLAEGQGYIRVPRFEPDMAYLSDFDAAMADLAGSEMIVLDLRSNCGGDEMAVRHLSTYFFDGPTHLVNTQVGDTIRERWTLDRVPGPRNPEAALYILVDNGTFSAAESFTFGMRATGRGKVVGLPTGGGGHFGARVELTDQLRIFVPFGRTFDPRTGDGWEATGLAPEIQTADADQALAAAQADFANRPAR